MGQNQTKEAREASDRLMRIEALLLAQQQRRTSKGGQPLGGDFTPAQPSLMVKPPPGAPPLGGPSTPSRTTFGVTSTTNGTGAGMFTTGSSGAFAVGGGGGHGLGGGGGGSAKLQASFLEHPDDEGDAKKEKEFEPPQLSVSSDRIGSVRSPKSGAGDSTPMNKNKGGAQARVIANAVKAKRKEFFDPLEFKEPWTEIPKCAGVKCVWLHCAAMAIEFASGEKVLMEDILNTNHMALHYVSFPSVTLAELYDNIDEFIKNTPSLLEKVRCEVATFDTDLVDEADVSATAHGNTGERAPVLNLVMFRKLLAAEMSDDSDSCFVFNYDPFIVQENEFKRPGDETDEDDEEDEEDDATAAKKKKDAPPKQWAKKNQGNFAILTNFNAALHTVTIATPHLTPEGQTVLFPHVVPLQAFYHACCMKDGYTKRPRGFVRVFKNPPRSKHSCVKSKIPLSTLDGRDARGMISIALEISICPHILGLGILHHLVVAAMLDTQRRGSLTAGNRGIQLRGIQVYEIVRRLQLPVGVIVGGSTRASLPIATALYDAYLHEVALHDTVHLGMVRILRRDDADDGAVNIDEDEFKKFVLDTTSDSEVLVLLSFNINVAQNVRVVDETQQDPTHFGFLIGYDPDLEIVQIADVSVKKFRKIWHAPLAQIYAAVIGRGFMTLARNKTVANRFDGVENVTKLRAQAQYRMPPKNSIKMFEYPKKNYSMTILAAVLNKMEFSCTFEEVLYHAGFHISFLLSEHLPLTAVQRIASYYCFYHLNDAVSSTAYHLDPECDISKDGFVQMVKKSIFGHDATKVKPGDERIIVNYSAAAMAKKSDIWNGSFGGNWAVVVGFDDVSDTVLLEDSNPEPFYRTWSCPVDVLMALMRERDPIPERARGFLVLRKVPNTEMRNARLIDHRRAQSFHPFKNPVSAHATAVALAISELIGSALSQEDVIYSGGEDFRLISLMANADLAATEALAKSLLSRHTALARVKLSTKKNSTRSDSEFLNELEPSPSRVSVLVYDIQKLFPFAEEKTGAGVVNRAVKDEPMVVVCDGNANRFGGQWARQVGEVRAATVGFLHFYV